MKFAKPVRAALAVLMLSVPALEAQAVLNAVDPGPYDDAAHEPYGSFPIWYQDTNGRALELCLSPAVIAPNARPGLAGGPGCTLLANPGVFDPARPIAFPTNFPDESFWFMGDSVFTQNGFNVTYVSNLEAAFGGGLPAVGDQVSFARIRIRIDVPNNAPVGTYTVIHPYGVEVFPNVIPQPKAINATRDIGIGAPGVFTGALKGDIGPFLMDATVPTLGLIPGLDPVTNAPTGELFVGDPNTARPVVGSPFGTNFVRIVGPNGNVVAESNLFNVMGKVYTAQQLPTPLVLERSTYSRTAAAAQQDVFAKAPATSDPLSYSDSAGNPIPMTDGDANTGWYGQSLTNPELPATVTVTASNPANNNSTSTATSDLVDLVTITRADYNPATLELTVEARSSDEVALPGLQVNVNGVLTTMGGAGVLKSVTIPGLAIPPAYVTVTSDNLGSDKEDVVVLP